MNNILNAIVAAGGRPIKVGGCVRDKILGIDSKDVDVEVFGLSSDDLCGVLSNFGEICLVGVSFGVIKLTTDTDDFDFTLPRRDNKTGVGHRGFQVEVDHTMTPEEAALRRDFTINAIGETVDGEIVDPFGGVADMRAGVLRATSEHFSEDPLRVLRGFQFAARFNLVAEPKTLSMCKELLTEASSLPLERVWGEWEKWALRSETPSHGLKFLVSSGWVDQHPELVNLIGVPQDPVWHPEGCAWTHTMHVCDAMVRICDRIGVEGEDRVVLVLAALCHDLGKAFPENGGTTVFERDKWRSPGHADAGVPLAERFLKRIGCFQRIIDRVLPLVAEHMICTIDNISDRVVRRLSVRLGDSTISELLTLVEADHAGRPPLPADFPVEFEEIFNIAERLKIDLLKPEPIIGGRHLIELRFKPGPFFGKVIKACFEAQLDGTFEDEAGAIAFLDGFLKGCGESVANWS